jgi:tellurium resistance protein TerD
MTERVSFKLEKGVAFQLEKGLKKVRICMGWKAPEEVNGRAYDLDLSAIGLVNNSGSPFFYEGGTHALCWSNPTVKKNPDKTFITADGSMKHFGDLKAGGEERIEIDFSLLPSEIDDITIFATIHKAKENGQDFSQTKDSYVRIIDLETNAELCIYQLKESFAGKTAVQVGSLFKKNDSWSFQTTGGGMVASLNDILGQY